MYKVGPRTESGYKADMGRISYIFNLAWKAGVLGQVSNFVPLFLGALAAFVQAIWGADEPIFPWWLSITVGAFLSCLLALWTIGNRAYELEEAAKPTLKISFEPRTVDCEEVSQKALWDTPAPSRTFRIKVTNTGPQRLERCSVKLERNLDAQGHDTRESTDLSFKQSNDRPYDAINIGHHQEFDLPGHDHIFIDLAKMLELSEPNLFYICYAERAHSQENWGKMPIEKGPHRITIRAVGAPMPTYREFEIGKGENGTLYVKDLGDPKERPESDIRYD